MSNDDNPFLSRIKHILHDNPSDFQSQIKNLLYEKSTVDDEEEFSRISSGYSSLRSSPNIQSSDSDQDQDVEREAEKEHKEEEVEPDIMSREFKLLLGFMDFIEFTSSNHNHNINEKRNKINRAWLRLDMAKTYQLLANKDEKEKSNHELFLAQQHLVMQVLGHGLDVYRYEQEEHKKKHKSDKKYIKLFLEYANIGSIDSDYSSEDGCHSRIHPYPSHSTYPPF